MKRFRAVTVISMSVLLSGCYGTVVGTVSGPLMGGPSLAGKLHDSDAPMGTKIVGTPFSLVTGALLGIFPGIYHGVKFDMNWWNEDTPPPDMHDLFDPWHDHFDEHRRLFDREEEGLQGDRPRRKTW